MLRKMRSVPGVMFLALVLVAGIIAVVVPTTMSKSAAPILKLAAATCAKAGTTAPVNLLPIVSSIRTNESQDDQLLNTGGAWTPMDCGTLDFTIPPIIGALQNFLLEVEVDAEGFCTGPTGKLCEVRVLAAGTEMTPAASSPIDPTSWFHATSGGPDDANSRGLSRVAVVKCANPLVGCTFQVAVEVKTPSGTTLSLDNTNVRGKITNGIDIMQGFVPLPV